MEKVYRGGNKGLITTLKWTTFECFFLDILQVSELAKILHFNHPAWFLYFKSTTKWSFQISRTCLLGVYKAPQVLFWIVDKCEIFDPGYFGRGNNAFCFKYWCIWIFLHKRVVPYLCCSFLYKTSLNDWVTNAKLRT